MPYMTFETESEESERHGDNEDQEVVYQELLVKAGLATDEQAIAASKAIAQTRAIPLVCSCGSMRCYMVRRYGLPKPTFHAEIEPVYPQASRDRKALTLVGNDS
jgi:hypothetical protein